MNLAMRSESLTPGRKLGPAASYGLILSPRVGAFRLVIHDRFWVLWKWVDRVCCKADVETVMLKLAVER